MRSFGDQYSPAWISDLFLSSLFQHTNDLRQIKDSHQETLIEKQPQQPGMKMKNESDSNQNAKEIQRMTVERRVLVKGSQKQQRPLSIIT